MDFSNRNTQQPNNGSHNPQNTVAANQSTNTFRKDGRKDNNQNKLLRIFSVALGTTVSILVVALLAYIAFSGHNTNNENTYINKSKLQAVFLNTGQVYFGNIKTINSSYYVLTNIYYLQTSNSSSSTSTTAANSSVSLVKLGCELHAPYDQMVINSQQVTFWENLKPSGQVAKAVAAFEKANPNGQTCSSQPTTATNSGNTVNTSTPTSSTSVKTPVK